jgi:hypothetical protein
VNTLFGSCQIKTAAHELMVESLKQEATEKRISCLLDEDLSNVDFSVVVKAITARSLPAGYYDAATYLMWLRGILESGVALPVLADEAEGLSHIEAARCEFECGHPPCPRCGKRQFSTTVVICRNCKLNFKKGN